MNGEEAIRRYKEGEFVAIKRNAWGDTAWCTVEGANHTITALMNDRRVPISRVDLASDDWEGAFPPKDATNPSFKAMIAAMDEQRSVKRSKR